MNWLTPARRKWLLAAAKLAIVLLVVWYVRREIVNDWQALKENPPTLHVGWLVAAGALYLAALLSAGLFWFRVLRALGQQTAHFNTLRAYFIGHLGKYVPGKAMVVVLRAGMIRGEGVDTSLAAVSVFVETLTMMAVGACMAAGILLIDPPADKRYLLAALGCMAAVTVPTIPPIFRRLLPRLGIGKSSPEIGRKVAGLTAVTLAGGWLSMFVAWLLLGLSLWAVVRGLGGVDTDPLGHFPRYVAAIALATVVGFVSMVPAGLGTREGAMVLMLSTYIGGVNAGLVAVVHRLVTVLAEVAISIILYFMERK